MLLATLNLRAHSGEKIKDPFQSPPTKTKKLKSQTNIFSPTRQEQQDWTIMDTSS